MSNLLNLRHDRKIQISSLLIKDGSNEGTAARTRPFSYHEIMLRRKNKKQTGNDNSNHFDVDIGTHKISHDSVPDKSEPSQGHSRLKHTTAGTSILVSGEFKNFRPRAVDKASIKDDTEQISRSKAPSRLTDIIQTKPSKHTVKVGKRSKIDDEHVVKIRNRRTIEEWSGDDHDLEKEYKRKKLKDPVRSYKHLEGDEGKFQSERRLSRNTSDLRSMRAHEHRRSHTFGSSKKERKESSPPSYHEETISRRRRSKSPITSKGKNRRSVSPSGSHQRESYHHREHAHHHKLKDPPGWKDYDEPKGHIYSNGSRTHHKRHGTFTGSRLGGYSPRKRRSEISARTPSPVTRSPVRNIADSSQAIRVSDKPASNVEPSDRREPSAVGEPAKVFSPFPSSEAGLGFSAVTSIPPPMVSMDSVQLTQATRPMRRLHIENLTASASEKALMEFLNNYLLGSGSNHIHGIWPCISCNIHRERGHAFVEFLTPEDASMALSLDGKPFSGSFLRVKRPKDFVEVATGSVEKIPSVAVAISSTVRDSPNKIFMGGISEGLSSDVIMEIVSAFGMLKAFRFQAKDDLIQYHCAFFEYLDPSVTPKACAGLSGLRLGGKIVTVVPVFPDASALGVDGETTTPFYGLPEHAKPLLEEPTRVLKLINVLDLELLLLMEEAEVEEALEDVRLECARFGSVKSVNIIRCNDGIPTSCVTPPDVEKDEPLRILPEGEREQLHLDIKDDIETIGLRQVIEEDAPPLEEETPPVVPEEEPEEWAGKTGGVGEPVHVLVEFKREEASCVAAHSLHGRAFDHRVISVAYVSLDQLTVSDSMTRNFSRA